MTCAPPTPNYINIFGIFPFFLISKYKFQWQNTMNRGLSYLKHEFTALVWKKNSITIGDGWNKQDKNIFCTIEINV